MGPVLFFFFFFFFRFSPVALLRTYVRTYVGLGLTTTASAGELLPWSCGSWLTCWAAGAQEISMAAGRSPVSIRAPSLRQEHASMANGHVVACLSLAAALFKAGLALTRF